jgi:hypothetical protein
MPTGTLTWPGPTTTRHRYEIHGYDDCRIVRARLTEHGQCSHTTWELGPPAWRLRYDTSLWLNEVEQLLQDLVCRYDLKIYEIH